MDSIFNKLSLWEREATDLNSRNISLENDRFHKRGANEVLWEIQKRVFWWEG